MTSERDEGAPAEPPTVADFFDGLDKRLGRQECPICGVDDWHFVLEPVFVRAERGAEGNAVRADMSIAMAVCKSCRFVRMHLGNPLPDVTVWMDPLS